MLSATKHLMRQSNLTQTLMNTRNVSTLMKNVSFLVNFFLLKFLLYPAAFIRRKFTQLNGQSSFYRISTNLIDCNADSSEYPTLGIAIDFALFHNFLEIFHHANLF